MMKLWERPSSGQISVESRTSVIGWNSSSVIFFSLAVEITQKYFIYRIARFFGIHGHTAQMPITLLHVLTVCFLREVTDHLQIIRAILPHALPEGLFEQQTCAPIHVKDVICNICYISFKASNYVSFIVPKNKNRLRHSVLRQKKKIEFPIMFCV